MGPIYSGCVSFSFKKIWRYSLTLLDGAEAEDIFSKNFKFYDFGYEDVHYDDVRPDDIDYDGVPIF